MRWFYRLVGGQGASWFFRLGGGQGALVLPAIRGPGREVLGEGQGAGLLGRPGREVRFFSQIRISAKVYWILFSFFLQCFCCRHIKNNFSHC